MNNIIQVMYHTNVKEIEYISIGDWLDLRSAEDVTMHQGDFKIISLGISVVLPLNHEAHIVPRSSTFKNFGILQTNGIGIIDESYCGIKDIWMFPAYATRDTVIHKNDRICQFRIFEKMPTVSIVKIVNTHKKNRGGLGSTGVK